MEKISMGEDYDVAIRQVENMVDVMLLLSVMERDLISMGIVALMNHPELDTLIPWERNKPWRR